ncbi:unnamed protein product, partial [Timema podura]|nr:unnamed protein product [Timema podura]
ICARPLPSLAKLDGETHRMFLIAILFRGPKPILHLKETTDESNYFINSIQLQKRYRRIMYSVYDKDPSQPEQIWSHFILPYSTEGIAIYGSNMIGKSRCKEDINRSDVRLGNQSIEM